MIDIDKLKKFLKENGEGYASGKKVQRKEQTVQESLASKVQIFQISNMKIFIMEVRNLWDKR